MYQNKTNNDGRLTLANFISFGLGLAVFAVTFWLGLLFFGKEMSTSIICAVLATLFFGIMLWLMIRAKSADADWGKWKFVEIAILSCYIVLAAFSIWPISRFFSVNSQSSEIKAAAQEDISAIEKQLKMFQEQEKQSLERTLTGMKTYISSRRANGTSREIEDFFADSKHMASMTDMGVESYRNVWGRKIEKYIMDGMTYGDAWNEAIGESKRQVERWNLIKVPQAVQTINNLSTEIGAKLTQMSESFPFPIIEGRTFARKSQPNSYAALQAKSPKVFSEIGDFSILGILVGIIIHLLILFNYFVTNRDRKVGLENYTAPDGGGIVLR